jgi:voltage-gated potassium channel
VKQNGFKRIYFGLLLLFSVIVLGVTGFMFLEHYTFTEAFFMTTITIATVGFREVQPLSNLGMWFTSFLIIFSFGIFAYVVTSFTQFVVDGVFRNYFRNKRMQNKIDKLNNHVIICGYGRNGKQSVLELLSHNEPLVVIESDITHLEYLRDGGDILYIEGDATQDEVLMLAGLERAKALIATLPNDANNVFLVLTARQLNPNITIISRASEDSADLKLRRAGADNVIMPDKIGGRRMARLVAQPDVVEFMEYMMLQSSENVILDEINLERLTDYFNGRPLRDLERINDTGAKIIGIKQQGRFFSINPLPETSLSARDKLFALGTKKQIVQLRDLISNPGIHDNN